MTAAAHKHLFFIASLLTALAVAATTATPSLAAGCGSRSTGKVFSRFGDSNDYFLAPGGSFEGSGGWALSGGAGVAGGNETYYASSTSDTRSVRLPVGATASSPFFCVGKDEPSLRFFAKTFASGSGGNYSQLNVSMVIRGSSGSVVSIFLGTLGSNGFGSWKPSGSYSYSPWLRQPWLYANGAQTVQVQFQFNVQGSGGTWQVDDVFVDPFKGT